MDDLKKDKAKPKTPDKKDSIKNVSGRRHKVYGTTVQPGEEYTPTDADKKDVRSEQRVENAIEAGNLKRV